MRVLAAFDKFKESLSATEACDVARDAVMGAHADWVVESCPLTDGGEGFSEILTRAARGAEMHLDVTGPRGGPARGAYGIVPGMQVPAGARALLGTGHGPGDIAVVEMASASGLALVEPSIRDPLLASSVGTGQLIRAVGDSGARAILLGIGGSATHDLGLGALGALGIRFLTASGQHIDSLVPADWPRIHAIEGSLPATLPPILIACDVDNPLLGPRGAATTYGPQKGLKRADFDAVERETTRIAALVCRHFGRPESLAAQPGAGAAGGISFGLMAAAGARLLPGFDLVASWLDLDRRLAEVDIILTGEGRFDETSLSGKGPGEVVRRSLALGKTVHVFAGQVVLGREIPGLFAHAITPAATPMPEALTKARAFLSSAVRQVFSSG